LGFQWFRQFKSVGFPDDLLEVRKLALAQRAPKPITREQMLQVCCRIGPESRDRRLSAADDYAFRKP